MLQWLTRWREEAVNIEQQNRTRGENIVKDRLLGKGWYSDGQEQMQFDDTAIDCLFDDTTIV